MSEAGRDRDRVDVNLPDGRGYPILIGEGLLSQAGSLLREHGVRGELFVLSDHTVWGLLGARLAAGLEAAGYRLLESFLVAPGEESKSLENWRTVLDRLVALDDGAARRIILLNLGGGVIGDLGGFAAAAYRRGTPFIQVPTTLLAQVDSSVGGKTGVNHPGGKNLVGAFHQPLLVLVDPETLSTLPVREMRAGLAEIVKLGLIRDEALFARLEADFPPDRRLQGPLLRHLIRRSCEIKAEVVARDEREQQGVRTLLNFGHTFGHALEAATDYRRYLHGEAVAIGMLCAAWISVETGLLPAAARERIRALLLRLGLADRAEGVDPARVRAAMKRDKKFTNARNRLVLLEGIGKARVVEGIDAELLDRALRFHLWPAGF